MECAFTIVACHPRVSSSNSAHQAQLDRFQDILAWINNASSENQSSSQIRSNAHQRRRGQQPYRLLRSHQGGFNVSQTGFFGTQRDVARRTTFLGTFRGELKRSIQHQGPCNQSEWYIGTSSDVIRCESFPSDPVSAPAPPWSPDVKSFFAPTDTTLQRLRKQVRARRRSEAWGAGKAENIDWTRFDVIVVGAGAAGLYAALSLPEHLKVGLLTKEQFGGTSSSAWAQGGIAAVTHTDPEDSVDMHVADTLYAGDGLCEPDAVHFLVENGQSAIDSLLKIGTRFDTDGDKVALGLEAAHSRPRILHAADATGREIVRSLKEEVVRRENVTVVDQAVVVDVWVKDDVCKGLYIAHASKLFRVSAKAVVLATGGGGQMFKPTSNPAAITGDSVALAWRAGAVVRDLEFVQFHPTTLYIPGAPTTLVTEAVRGAGALLVDHTGERFMARYHKDAELAPRSVVSRAIFDHMLKTNAKCVYLLLSQTPPEVIDRRFPNLVQICREWGLNVYKEPIPVAPAAHYWMGGAVTDLDAQTTISGLYAIGEAASTGVHGANRLASNSLLECIVFAKQLAAIELGEKIANENDGDVEDREWIGVLKSWDEQKAALDRIRADLPDLMGESAGICRDETRLTAAIGRVEEWLAELGALPATNDLTQCVTSESGGVAIPFSYDELKLWSDTRNMLQVARLILLSARFRPESRGSHFRSDYPIPDPEWQAHTLVHHDAIWRSALVSTSRPPADRATATVFHCQTEVHSSPHEIPAHP